MYLINGQPYADLTNFVDIQGLEDIKLDIAMGIAKSWNSLVVSSATIGNCLVQEPDSIMTKTYDQILRDPLNPNHEYFKELGFNRNLCSRFIIMSDQVQTLGQMIVLRWFKIDRAVHLKSSADGCRDTPAYDNFPSLRNWIGQLKVFDQIGRINFWINSPGEPSCIHKDAFLGTPDNFLQINLDPTRKSVFVLDDHGQQHTITSKVSVFDIRNYHGSQGHGSHGWTLRIDGVYNQEWATQAGIWDHFKPNN
jgi:hypothetical protein